MIEKRPFGKTGFDVSVLGFGAAPSAFLKTDADAVTRMIESLLDQGMNLIDTAMSYPGSEEFIGAHLAHRRKDFVLVSKCGQTPPGTDLPAWSEAAITFAVDRALRVLKTDHVDAMLLHTCDFETLKKGEAVGALVKAREAGKIKFAGFSGDNESLAYAAGHPELAVLETSVNIVDQANIALGLPVAARNGKGVLAKRPMANACWKDLNEQQGMYRDYAAGYSKRLAHMGVTPTDVGFADNSGEAWAEMALRFTLSQPGVSTGIVGTTNPANAANNFKYASRGPLGAAAVQKIRDAFKKADPNGSWTGQT